MSVSEHVAACEKVLKEAGTENAASRLRHEYRRRVGRGFRRDQALPRSGARYGGAAHLDDAKVWNAHSTEIRPWTTRLLASGRNWEWNDGRTEDWKVGQSMNFSVHRSTIYPRQSVGWALPTISCRLQSIIICHKTGFY